MNMLKDHDLNKLEARGFNVHERFVRDQLDGVTASLRLNGSIYLKIYQGCQGMYELQGQGRGRPKQHVLIDYEWFDPSWYIRRRVTDGWEDVADGSQVNVDLAVEVALDYFRRLFPNVELPASVA